MSDRPNSDTRVAGVFVPPADVELHLLGGWSLALFDGQHVYADDRVLLVPPAEERRGEAA